MIRPELARREEIFIDRRHEGPPLEGQAVLFEQYSLLRRTWKWVLLVAIVGTAIAGYYVMNFVPKEYKAVIRVVPPNKTGSPLDNILGGLSASLKDFGLGKLVGGKSGESGYSRVALLFSRSVVDSLIAKYDLADVYEEIPRDRPDLLAEAVRGNIDVQVDLEGPIDISIHDRDPKRAALMVADIVKFSDAIARDLNRRETEPISRAIEKRYLQVRDDQARLGAQMRSFMKDNKIYDPEKQPQIVGMAMAEAEALVRAQRIVVESLEATLGPQDARVQTERTILANLESEARKMAAGKGSAVPGFNISTAPNAVVEGLGIQTEYEINAKLLALVQPMYEQSVLDQSRDIPILHVVDPPTVPLHKARPKYSLVFAGAFVGSWLMAYIVIALISYGKSFNRRYRAYMVTANTNGVPRN
jgi:tyrosine-protein kinase Etk/Wzc